MKTLLLFLILIIFLTGFIADMVAGEGGWTEKKEKQQDKT